MKINKDKALPLLRILLIEDNEHDKLAFSRAFKKANVPHDIKWFVHAEEALQTLSVNTSQFDIIVSDYMLPGMNGLELCKELVKKMVPVPIVLLTGTGSENIAVEALKAGAADYVVKDPEHGYLKLLPIVLADVIRKYDDSVKRKQAEDEREQALSKLRTTLDATADGILVVDMNGKTVLFNKRFTKMWKLQANILNSQDDSRVLTFVMDQLKNPDDFLTKVKELYADFEAKSFDTLEFNDGRIFERYSRPHLLNEEIVGRVWSFRDVTDLKLAEETLKKSENRYKLLTENAKDMIYRMSLPEGCYEFVSPASIDVFGYSPEEFYNSTVLIQKIIHPDWHNYFKEQWTLLLKGKILPVYEYQIIHKSGETKWINQRNTLILDENEKPLAIEGIVTDITERKQILERTEGLNSLNERLLVSGSLYYKAKLITEEIIKIFKADFARIWMIKSGDLCDSECQQAKITKGPHVCHYRERCLHLLASSGRYTHIDGGHRRVPLGSYKIGKIAAGDEPKFLTNDVVNDPLVSDHEWPPVSG